MAFEQKWLYSEKLVEFGQSGCVRAKVVVFGKSSCNRAEWLYSGKVVVVGTTSFCSGKSGC